MNNIGAKQKLDTGSDITITNEKFWKNIREPTLKNTKKFARGI